MKKKTKYTFKQIVFLRTGYQYMNIRSLTRAFNKRFGTSKTELQIKSTLTYHKIRCGRKPKGFYKGHKPWNTGTKGQGLTCANSGSFKKGNVPPNRKPLGSERICSQSGLILIKVAERDPNRGYPTRYKHKHVHIWEQANGPVPEGMVVAFVDCERTNCELENLMLISRAELLALNRIGYKDMPDSLKPSVLALSKLQVKTFAKEKQAISM